MPFSCKAATRNSLCSSVSADQISQLHPPETNPRPLPLSAAPEYPLLEDSPSREELAPGSSVAPPVPQVPERRRHQHRQSHRSPARLSPPSQTAKMARRFRTRENC